MTIRQWTHYWEKGSFIVWLCLGPHWVVCNVWTQVLENNCSRISWLQFITHTQFISNCVLICTEMYNKTFDRNLAKPSCRKWSKGGKIRFCESEGGNGVKIRVHKYTALRGIWEHTPPENFCILNSLKLLLVHSQVHTWLKWEWPEVITVTVAFSGTVLSYCTCQNGESDTSYVNLISIMSVGLMQCL